MFLLDTNVISELRKPAARRDANVWAWVTRTPEPDVRLSVITLLELEQGVLQVERRDLSQATFMRAWLTMVRERYAGRMLPVDEAVANQCAGLHVPDRRPERDALIAATALVHGLTVVTRDVKDFAPMGVPLLNPWEWGQTDR